MKKLVLSLVVFLGLAVTPVFANEKYVTVVNPIRSRQLWRDKSLQPLVKQYQTVSALKVQATWLVQDDVLSDSGVVDAVKKFNTGQEVGLFLEISKPLTDKARVYYATETEWYNPRVVFLSGYSPSQRQKLIDTMIADFKTTFGYLPKSAGAWWIDSWSQQYLEKQYGIQNLLIVADQKTTDSYGVWGQWWGYPYHPSPDNILVPGNSPTVVIQWAQRDLAKAYAGQGPAVSNHSVQANDYQSLGLTTSYFKDLAKNYLDVTPLSQLTVGLETGIESVGNEQEYARQLKWTADNKITSLSMNAFGNKYRQRYGETNPEQIVLDSWILTPKSRSNASLGEKITYAPDISFQDKFMADNSNFLNRILPNGQTRQAVPYWPLFLLVLPILWWITRDPGSIMWVLVLYLPIFKSYYASGWKVFFGPALDHLMLAQIAILGIGGLVISFIAKKGKIDWTAWWSVWILNLLIFKARMSIIGGKYYLGWLWDSFRFVGVVLGGGVRFVNQDLEGYIAATMYKVKPSWLWDKPLMWVVVYPLAEVVLVYVIGRLVPKKLRYLLAIVSLSFVWYTLHLDPMVAK